MGCRPGQMDRKDWLESDDCAPRHCRGQSLAMAIHAPAIHAPAISATAHLEVLRPSIMLVSRKNQVSPRMEVEIPLRLLICVPWEVRCLAQLFHLLKSYWFGYWWKMNEKASGLHVLQTSGQASRKL